MEKKYYKHKVENLIRVSKIVTVHYFEFPKDFAFRGEQHDFWEIVYAVKNDVICSRNGREEVLRQGQMLFHKPGEVHALRADGVNAPIIFVVSFSAQGEALGVLEGKTVLLGKNLEHFIYSIIEESKNTFDIPVSDPAALKMELREDRALGGLQLIRNDLENLLIHILRNEAEKKNSDTVFLIKTDYRGDLAGKVMQYLNEHVDMQVSITTLEKTFHYNKSYLFDVFKKSTGHTIIDYFTLLKIEKAKQLLENTNLDVREIAAGLGFDSPSYFCRVFRSRVRITPLQYRKSKQ